MSTGRREVFGFSLLVLITVLECVRPANASCYGLATTCTTINKSFSSIKEQICSRPTSNSISSQPPCFIIEPSNQIAGSRLDGYALFQCSITQTVGYNPSFSWEHNGDTIANGDMFTITRETWSSSLRVQVLESTQGLYRCVVSSPSSEYSITSQYGSLHVKSCSGWIDHVLNSSYSDSNTVEIDISKGASTILECSPRDKLSLPVTTWLKGNNATGVLDADHVQLLGGSLLVRNFNPPPEGVITYHCLVVSSDCPQLDRVFKLRASEGPSAPVAPSNQTSVVGSAVSLYCITDSKSPNTWYKEGVPLNLETFDWSMTGPMNEVLVLSNVTMETGGLYSCVSEDGSNMTSLLTVLAPPTTASILVSDESIHSHTLLLPSPQQGHNSSLFLTCITDSPSGNSGVTFDWFFGGSPIESTLQENMSFSKDGPFLNVTGMNVYGSYQCVASSKAGGASTVLFVFSDKPHPPSSVTLTLDRDRNVTRPTDTYLYQFLIEPPVMTFEPVTSYDVQVYIHRSLDNFYDKCTCTLDENIDSARGGVNFLANDFVDKRVYFRVAANSGRGLQSDYLPYYEGSSCGTMIDIVSPPAPQMNWSSQREGDIWSVTLNWNGPTERQYPSKLYTTDVTIECAGMKSLSLMFPKSTWSHALPVQCSTQCTWTVTYTTVSGSMQSTKTQNFTTSSIIPTQPPVLNLVSRTNSDGRSLELDFTLPPDNVSCTPTKYSAHISGSESPLTNCQLVQERRYKCVMILSEERCWQPLNVSVSFGNDGGWSVPSIPILLPGVRQADLSGFSNLSVTDVSPDSITISVQLESGIQCLLSHRPNTSANVCITPHTPETEPSCVDINDPHLIRDSFFSHTFTKLRGLTEYSITATLTVSSVGQRSMMVSRRTSEGVPSVAPQNLTIFPIHKDEQLFLSWTAPPIESLNGELVYYSLTYSTINGGHTVNLTRGTSYILGAYNASIQYLVTVCACTDVGCGPEEEQVFPPTHPAQTDSPHNTEAPRLSPTVKIAVAVTVCAVVLILIVVCSIVVVVCCAIKKCRSCRKKESEYEQLDRRRLLGHDQNERLHDDDLVSVGEPDGAAPSIHSDHTNLDTFKSRMIDDYLNDLEQIKQDPDGMEGDLGEVENDRREMETEAEIHNLSNIKGIIDRPPPVRLNPRKHKSHHKHRNSRSKSRSHRHAKHEREPDKDVFENQPRDEQQLVTEQGYIRDHLGTSCESSSVAPPNTTSQRPPTEGNTTFEPSPPAELLSPTISLPIPSLASFQFSNSSPSSPQIPEHKFLEQMNNSSGYICPETVSTGEYTSRTTDSHVTATPSLQTTASSQYTASKYVQPSPSLGCDLPSIHTVGDNSRYVREKHASHPLLQLDTGYVTVQPGVASSSSTVDHPYASADSRGYVSLSNTGTITTTNFDGRDAEVGVICSSPETLSLDSSVFEDDPLLSNNTESSHFAHRAATEIGLHSTRREAVSSGAYSMSSEIIEQTDQILLHSFRTSSDNGYVTDSHLNFSTGRNTPGYSRSSSEGYSSVPPTPATPEKKVFSLPQTDKPGRECSREQRLSTLNSHYPNTHTLTPVVNRPTRHMGAPLLDTDHPTELSLSSTLPKHHTNSSSSLVTSPPSSSLTPNTHTTSNLKQVYTIPSLLAKTEPRPAARESVAMATADSCVDSRHRFSSLKDYHNTCDIDVESIKTTLDALTETSFTSWNN